MKHNTWFNLLMALGLALVLGGGLAVLPRVRAQGAESPELAGLQTLEMAMSTETQSFQAGSSFTYHSIDGSYPFCTAVATADLNNDGWIDILAASENMTGAIQSWENFGDGVLATGPTLSSGHGGATTLLGRDLNDNGLTDVALISEHKSSFAILEQMSDGAWTRDEPFPTSTYPPSALAPIDAEITGDSYLMIGALGHASGAYLIPYLSTSFLTQKISSNDHPSAVYLDDIDRDGDVDYVVADFYRNGISWYKYNPGGGITTNSIDNFGRTVWLRSADMDRDGDPDIVAASDMHGLAWWANNGSGTAWTKHTIMMREFYQGTSLTLADLDADGDLDIVAGTKRQLVWLENLGRPGDETYNWIRHTIDTNPYADSFGYAVAVGDIDRDGRLDIVGCDYEAGPGSTAGRRLGWWENKRSSVPTSEINFTGHDIDTALTGAWGVDLNDFNGDGRLDVAASGYGISGVTGEARLYSSTLGLPSWTWSKFFDVSFDKGRGLTTYQVGNGHPTFIVSGDAHTGEAREFWSTDWNWVTSMAQDARLTGLGTTYQAAVGDLNDDGVADVVGTSASNNKIVWWNGRTNTQTVIDSSCAGARAVCLGDVDGDGLVDVGAACSGESNIIFLRQTGNPVMPWDRFASSVWFGGATDITCGDLDGDGRTDLVAARPGPPGWIGAMGYVATGGGGGDFTWKWVTTAFTGTEHLALSDIDRDGDLDVAATSASRGEVTWFENTGISFASHIVDESMGSLREIAIGDINSDGAPDLVAASQSRNLVRWYEQQVATELSIEKQLDTTQSTGVISTGQSIPYIIEVTNNGVAGDMLVIDRWEPSDAIVGASSDEDCITNLSQGVMTCTLSLSNGQIKQMNVRITPGLLFDGYITNTAQVLPVSPFWNTVGYLDTDAAAPVEVQQNMAIWDGKINMGTSPDSLLLPGQTFTYTVGVVNFGPKSGATATMMNLWSPPSAIEGFTILGTPGSTSQLATADYICTTGDVEDGVMCDFTNLAVDVPITVTIGVTTSEQFTDLLEADIYLVGDGNEGYAANNEALPVRVGSRPWDKVYLPLVLRK